MANLSDKVAIQFSSRVIVQGLQVLDSNRADGGSSSRATACETYLAKVQLLADGLQRSGRDG